MLKEVNCYYCKSAATTDWAVENGYTMVKCSGCGLLYVNLRPDEAEITEAIRTGMHRGDKVLNMVGVYAGEAVVNGYVNKLTDFFSGRLKEKPFKWLDIGCGHGEFIEAVIKIGHPGAIVRGSEPSEAKAASARERGLDVRFISLESHGEKYDYISLLNVYSHLPDPEAFLTSLQKLLKPGGELILQTGDVKNLKRADFGHSLLLPDHLHFATQEIVKGLLKRAGFKVEQVIQYHHPAYRKYSVAAHAKDIIKTFIRKGHKPYNWFVGSKRDMWIRSKKRSMLIEYEKTT